MSTLSRIVFDPDLTPPGVPAITSVTAVSTSRLDVSWTTVTDNPGGSGLAGYNIQIDGGTAIELGVQTTYSAQGFSPATQHTFRVASRDQNGNVSAYSASSAGTTQAGQAPFNPTYPRLGTYIIGGQQNYQSATVMAAMAKRHVNIISHYPGWQNSKGTTLAAVTQSIKAQSTIGTKVFVYIITSSMYKAAAGTGQAFWEPYQRLLNNKEFAYTNGLAETGTLDSAADSSQLQTNYQLTGKLVGGKRYYQYIIDWNIAVTRDGVGASNGTTTLTAAPNPNLDGPFLDNAFSKERTNADYDRNGSLDGISSVANMQACQNAHVAAINHVKAVWPTALVMVNSADWREYETAYGFGSFSAAPLNQQAHGGAIESLELYDALAFSSVVSAIKTQMDAFLAPKLGVGGWKLASLTDYQMMRYGYGISLLTDTYYYPLVGTYRSEDLPSLWYDEFDNSLGTASEPVQTVARAQAGSLGQGVWRRAFQYGDTVVAAARQDGLTSYSAYALGRTMWLPLGTQAPTVNTGEAVSSLTLNHRDARIVLNNPPGIPTTFPLSISSTNRYLQSPNGTPWFLNGDTPWCAITQLTDTQWVTYLDDRATRGFNTLLLEIIEPRFSDSAPNMITGVAPFTTPNDIRTPNEAYFNRAASMCATAARKGFLLFATPAYLGFSGTSEGWLAAVQARTTTECQAFGAYLGEKFKGLPNIIWTMGGDYWNSAILTRTQALEAGLKLTGRSDWLFTYHTAPAASSADVVNAESWLNVNMTYEQDEAGIVTRLESDYARATTRPFFLAESKYEQENSVSRLVLRSQGYWSVLTGGCGPGFFGNSPIWHFDGVNLPFPTYTGTWPTNLASNGSIDRTVMKNFFTAFAWQNLVPDRNSSTLVSGASSGAARAYAARMPDGSKIVIYIPTQRAIGVDLSRLTGASSTATWVNAQTGATTSAGAFGVTGIQSFTPPTATDYLLVLDAVATAGTVVLNDDFSSYPLSSTTTASRTALVNNGPYLTLDADGGGPSRIEAWPLNSALKCFSMEYIADEGTDKLRFPFSGTVTHIIDEWDEIRSNGFDFSYTKDSRWPAFRLSNGSDSVDVDIYASTGRVVTTATSGVDNCTITSLQLQGPNIGFNTVGEVSFVMVRGEEYHFSYEIKINTPNTANGLSRVVITRKSNGQTTTITGNNLKFSKDGVEQCRFRQANWGMAATSGGLGFAGTSRIYRRNRKITVLG